MMRPDTDNPLDRVRVVLTRPLYGGNIGRVCRAMKNMGLSDLALVAPAATADEGECRKYALHAFDLYENRRRAGCLQEAVADCVLVAGTTAREGLYRSHARSPREWAPRLLAAASRGDPVALVFGPEDRGLENEDLALCTQIIQIPTSPAYASLNLAQAVLLCAYEMFLAADRFEPAGEASPEAPSHLRERMFQAWYDTLLTIGFMKEDKAAHMMMGLRRILSRGSLSENDVKILMGIAKQAGWCGRQLQDTGWRPDRERESAGGAPPDPDPA